MLGVIFFKITCCVRVLQIEWAEITWGIKSVFYNCHVNSFLQALYSHTEMCHYLLVLLIVVCVFWQLTVSFFLTTFVSIKVICHNSLKIPATFCYFSPSHELYWRRTSKWEISIGFPIVFFSVFLVAELLVIAQLQNHYLCCLF